MNTSDWALVGPVGLNGGRLDYFAKDPNNAQQMLAGSLVAGVFRTGDGGTTWQPSHSGMTLADGHVDTSSRGVAFDPNQPSVAFATTSGGGIFRSADGGQTWTNVYKANLGGGQFVFLGTSIYRATSNGVVVSSDGGKTWTVSLAGSAGNLTSAGGLTLATQGTKLFSLGAGGWTQIATLTTAANQLAIDPNNTQIIYGLFGCGRYGSCIDASLDGGKTFAQVSDPFSLGAQTIAFSKHFQHQLYAAQDGGGGWIAADGNTAPTWHTVSMGSDNRMIHVEVNAAGTDDRCYNATDQGVHVIDPCSVKGSPAPGITGTISVHWITGFAVNSDQQSVIAMVQDYSAYSSIDAGKTWHGLPIGEDGTAATSPTDPTRCYGYNGALYVSTDSCKTVTKNASTAGYGSPTFQSQVIAFDAKTPTMMYVVDSKSGGNGIVVSSDGGTTFTKTGWPFTAPYLIVADPSDGLHLLVGDGNTVSVSLDGGKTWAASTGLAAAGGYILAIDPANPLTVLAAVGASGGTDVYSSGNGGSSFTKLTHISASGLHNMAFNQPASGTPYVALASNNSGVWLSKDVGATWQRLEGIYVPKVTGAQWVKGTLYLSTYGQSILKTVAPLQ